MSYRATCFVLLFVGKAYAGDPDPENLDLINSWAGQISGTKAATIQTIKTGLTSQEWPKLAWRAALPHGATDATRQEESIALARSVIHGLVQYDIENPDQQRAKLDELVTTLSDLSVSFRKGDGLLNLLLSDSADRIALSRIASFVLNNTSEAKSVGSLLDTLHLGEFDTERLLAVNREETGRQLDLSALTEFEIIVRLMDEPLTSPPGAVFSKSFTLRIQRMPSNVLLQTGDIPALTQRLLETNKVRVKLLPGMIAYLERGGKLADIVSLRLPDLRKILGTDEMKRLGYPLLKERALSPADLRNLYEFKDSWRDNHFYKVAVEE